MILGFLLAIIAAAVIALIVIDLLNGQWLKKYIKEKFEKKKNKKNQKIVFADLNKVFDDDFINDIKNAPEIDMDELEKKCEDKRFVSAIVDIETMEFSEFDDIKPKNIDPHFLANLNRHDGILVIDEV